MQQSNLSKFYEMINIDKLRKSNDIGKKWADRFGISKNDYMRFIIDLKKNKNKYLQKLENKFRSQFSKDYKVMFYAAEVEEKIIQQFYHIVQHCLIKLCIKETYRDEYYSIGLTSLRSAIWNYRTHKIKASLFTFCFNGVFHRLLGLKTKLHSLNSNPNKKNTIIESDYLSTNKKSKFDLGAMKATVVDFDLNLENEESKSLLNSLLEQTELKDDEIFLLQSFMSRYDETPHWCRLYREKFLTKEGKMVSRQGVHCKLVIIQKKLFQTLKKLRKTRPLLLDSKFAV